MAVCWLLGALLVYASVSSLSAVLPSPIRPLAAPAKMQSPALLTAALTDAAPNLLATALTDAEVGLLGVALTRGVARELLVTALTR